MGTKYLLLSFTILAFSITMIQAQKESLAIETYWPSQTNSQISNSIDTDFYAHPLDLEANKILEIEIFTFNYYEEEVEKYYKPVRLVQSKQHNAIVKTSEWAKDNYYQPERWTLTQDKFSAEY